MRRPLLKRFIVGLVGLLLGLVVVGWGVTRLPPFGAAPKGERLERLRQSPQWFDGQFRNVQPQWLDLTGALGNAVFGEPSPGVDPTAPVAVVSTDPARLAAAPASGLRLTWFGHSSMLVEIDGVRLLVDPFWGERASPFSWIGPRRWYPPPIALADLPRIDAVVISHDHYDHLDQPTVTALAARGAVPFIVPLGVGAHLERWGVPADRIRELDWWQASSVGPVTVTATPGRHSTGRLEPSSDRVLWAGFALTGPMHRIWYSGDGAFHDGVAEIGQRLGPFDLALVDAGQYSVHWPDNHFGPEQAVAASREARAAAVVPIHWALLRLAAHGWTEPVERALAAGRCQGQPVLVLQPGLPHEPGVDPAPPRWWAADPASGSGVAAIRSTLAGDPSQRYPAFGCKPAAP